MDTNPGIDPELLSRAQRVGGERTKRATVTRALQEYIARRERASLPQSFGTLEWDDSFDYKTERGTRGRKHGLGD